eukprot:CAMPEP_0119559976 /NCGR_PEP_ID=MMETSP1352-20130426/13689_1 /TAXON_ID=265584 /ORGANISM="Stauroneis constricta, Strain CCMP1120" /LENGTH=575 /DNA_ID=CAMNT_0007607819 /DNA_START=138 /DNA_END=1865 /DNA_ORIENTATION=+
MRRSSLSRIHNELDMILDDMEPLEPSPLPVMDGGAMVDGNHINNRDHQDHHFDVVGSEFPFAVSLDNSNSSSSTYEPHEEATRRASANLMPRMMGQQQQQHQPPNYVQSSAHLGGNHHAGQQDQAPSPPQGQGQGRASITNAADPFVFRQEDFEPRPIELSRVRVVPHIAVSDILKCSPSAPVRTAGGCIKANDDNGNALMELFRPFFLSDESQDRASRPFDTSCSPSPAAVSPSNSIASLNGYDSNTTICWHGHDTKVASAAALSRKASSARSASLKRFQAEVTSKITQSSSSYKRRKLSSFLRGGSERGAGRIGKHAMILDETMDIMNSMDYAVMPPSTPNEATIARDAGMSQSAPTADFLDFVTYFDNDNDHSINNNSCFQPLMQPSSEAAAITCTAGSNGSRKSSSAPRRDNSSQKIRYHQDAQWRARYKELVEFKHRFGHSAVPHSHTENVPLAQWVKRQRYQKRLKQEGRHCTMTDEREQLLDAIGFVWDSHIALWEERFDELLGYKAQHGHCAVPARYQPNPTLAIWVKCQRRQYRIMQEGKKSNMTYERIDRLNSIGFIWSPRGGSM